MRKLIDLALELMMSGREPVLIDHAPIPPSNRRWRQEALDRACAKYGRPFKCAGRDVPAEVMVVPGVFAVKGAHRPEVVIRSAYVAPVQRLKRA